MSGLKKPKTSAAKQDDEISQIMSEIEDLQEEMSAPAAPVAKPSKLKAVPQPEAEPEIEHEDALSEFRAGPGNDADLDASIGDLSDEGQGSGNGLLDQVVEDTVSELEATEPVDETVQEEVQEELQEAVTTEDVTMHDETENSEEGCLTMTLTGKMALKLKYECGGQEVTVGFSEEFLKVQLADGTEFKVPVGITRKTLRKVA